MIFFFIYFLSGIFTRSRGYFFKKMHNDTLLYIWFSGLSWKNPGTYPVYSKILNIRIFWEQKKKPSTEYSQLLWQLTKNNSNLCRSFEWLFVIRPAFLRFSCMYCTYSGSSVSVHSASEVSLRVAESATARGLNEVDQLWFSFVACSAEACNLEEILFQSL